MNERAIQNKKTGYTQEVLAKALKGAASKEVYNSFYKKLKLTTAQETKNGLVIVLQCPNDTVQKENATNNYDNIFNTLSSFWPKLKSIAFTLPSDESLAMTDIRKVGDFPVNRNFIAYPLFAFDSRRKKDIEYQTKDGNKKITVTANEKFGFACIKDFNLLMVLFREMYIQKRNSGMAELYLEGRDNRVIDFSVVPSEILAALGKTDGGNNFKWLNKALDRLQNTYIRLDASKEDGGCLRTHWIETSYMEGDFLKIRLSSWAAHVLMTMQPLWIDDKRWFSFSDLEQSLYLIALSYCQKPKQFDKEQQYCGPTEVKKFFNLSTVCSLIGFQEEKLARFRSLIKGLCTDRYMSREHTKKIGEYIVQYIPKKMTKTKKEDQLCFIHRVGSDISSERHQYTLEGMADKGAKTAQA